MKNIAIRLATVFVTAAIPSIGVGAMFDVHAGVAALQAGAGAVLTVIYALARAYQDDGQLDAEEIEQAFGDE